MSKTNDPESADPPGSTRRSFLQKTGAGAAALAAYPMSHEGGDDGGWFSGLFSSAVDLTVMHDGEVVSHSLEELNIEGTAITEVTEVNAYDGRIRVTINGGGGGGAFEDTDGDGVAELHDDHVDMQGGDVLNGRNMGASGNPMGTAYVTSINGDGDQVDVSPSLGSTELRATRSADISVNIPSDYSTLQAAFDDLREQVIQNRLEVELFIETGHTIATGTTTASFDTNEAALVAENGDFSNFVIRSADATVPVETGFTGSVIRNINARGVRLGCQIDMANADSTNGAHGYTVELGGHGRVLDGSGVKNAVGRGLWLRGPCTFDRLGSTFDFSGAGGNGCYASHGAFGYIRGINFSGAGDNGIEVAEALVDCQSANVSSAASNGVYISSGGKAFCQSVDATGCGNAGFKAEGGEINAMDALADSCNIGVQALYDGSVRFDGTASADSCSYAISAINGTVEAEGTTLTNASGAYALRADRASQVNVRNADLSGGSATTKVQSWRGSTVVLVGATVGTTSNDNIEVSDGGLMQAHGASYNNANVTTNSLTTNGIIFA